MTPEFEKILQLGGTPTAQCACGRIHYVADGTFMEEGELERLQANNKSDSKNYIPDHDNDSIGIIDLNGVSYVWNCPCRLLDAVEGFLWDNREKFIQFYKQRSARERREVTDSEKLLAEI